MLPITWLRAETSDPAFLNGKRNSNKKKEKRVESLIMPPKVLVNCACKKKKENVLIYAIKERMKHDYELSLFPFLPSMFSENPAFWPH